MLTLKPCLMIVLICGRLSFSNSTFLCPFLTTCLVSPTLPANSCATPYPRSRSGAVRRRPQTSALSSEAAKPVRRPTHRSHLLPSWITNATLPYRVGSTTDFEGFTPYIRDLSKKQHVTSQSLQKIEQGTMLSSLPPLCQDLFAWRPLTPC